MNTPGIRRTLRHYSPLNPKGASEGINASGHSGETWPGRDLDLKKWFLRVGTGGKAQ